MNLLCERCGCTDPKYFVSFQGKDLCRRCISYQGNEGKSLSYEEDVVEQFIAGNEKVFGFLVGQVMKRTAGKSQPAKVSEALKEVIKSKTK